MSFSEFVNFKLINEITVGHTMISFMLKKISSEIEPPLQIQNANEEQLKFSRWSNWTKGALFPHFPYIGVKVSLNLFFNLLRFLIFLLFSLFLLNWLSNFRRRRDTKLPNLGITLEIKMLKIQSCQKCQSNKMFS